LAAIARRRVTAMPPTGAALTRVMTCRLGRARWRERPGAGTQGARPGAAHLHDPLPDSCRRM